MNNVAIFLELPNPYDYPLSKDDYLTSYSELCADLNKTGANAYIVRDQQTYAGNGTFLKSWQFTSEKKLIESGTIHADVVFNRGAFITDRKVPTFNHPDLNMLCTDKWVMYQRFSHFCPFTAICHSSAELTKALDQVTTELVVIKPVDGQEGKGVVITKKNEVQLSAHEEFPLIVQDFLDSSGGIPGIVEGLHDFRVALLNNEVIYSYYRTPPPGSYLANVARGGSFSMINPDRIPDSVMQIVEQVESEQSHIPFRFYGIDFAMTEKGPKIIEMNSRLGLLPNRDSHEFIILKQKLATTLFQIATSAEIGSKFL